MTAQQSNNSATRPLVSVIMNCLNCENYLREAIDSVYAQSYPNWEIIFWDNASTDRSGEIAQSYDCQLRYFRGEKTVPLGSARNKALEKVRGEFIAFLDCDDLWMPEKLEKQVEIFDNHAEIVFVYSNFFKFNKDKKRKVLLYKGKRFDGNVFESLLYHYDIGILTVMVRRRALYNLDELFDEKLNLAEEYDVFMRLLYDSQVAYIHEPLAMHRVHSNMLTRKNWKEFSAEIEYVVEKLKCLNPCFEEKYSEALKYNKKQLELQKAKDSMALGDLKNARKFLAPYKWLDSKFFVLYLASHMPVSLWIFLRPLWTIVTFR